MSKFGNVKVAVDGQKFDSKMEADYYYFLKIKLSRNEIKDFELHPKFTLQCGFKFHGKAIQAITYTSDFKVVYNDDTIHLVDIKGVKTNEFKIKEKMLKYKFQDVRHIDIYCLTLHKETWVKL